MVLAGVLAYLNAMRAAALTPLTSACKLAVGAGAGWFVVRDGACSPPAHALTRHRGLQRRDCLRLRNSLSDQREDHLELQQAETRAQDVESGSEHQQQRVVHFVATVLESWHAGWRSTKRAWIAWVLGGAGVVRVAQR